MGAPFVFPCTIQMTYSSETMKAALSVLLLLSPIGVAVTAQSKPAAKPAVASLEQQWGHLIDTKQFAKADKLCTSWMSSPDITKQVEAQKCLANVTLCRGSVLSVNGNEVGGGSIGEGYTPAAADEALKHLNEGIRLAPQDVSIHQGRLHVLEVTGRFDEMAKALDESIGIYSGPGTPDIWLAYAAELGNDGQPTAGLHISEVLYKHYPNNSDVIGNLGAFHDMLKQWDQGLPYLRQAVELNPKDPIDTWNLGWALDHLDQTEEADKWMSKSLQLGDNSETSDLNRKCLYGKFTVTKLHKKTEGCALVTANCDADDRAVCEAQATSTPKQQAPSK